MEQEILPNARCRSQKSVILSLVLGSGLVLSACDSEAPAPAPTQAASASEAPASTQPVSGERRTILAFGDSLFAGYNVPKADSYPADLETALRAQGIDARVVNAGVSGDTSAAGRQRFEFTLGSLEETPDLLILELGGNDLLRSIDPAETRANLAAIIEMAQNEGIDVLLLGMQAPPNVGPEFQSEFGAVYRSLAEEYGVALVPNWIAEVAARPELIQDDRVHPTVEGIDLLVQGTLDEVIAALPQREDP
ncbi:arylesterase [Qipengyuania sp. JC766]|uniref:arylesterase n=1 Tax=Qipengyuania sp. JC766 TaxID=3232139 RepID=UPI00345799CD